MLLLLVHDNKSVLVQVGQLGRYCTVMWQQNRLSDKEFHNQLFDILVTMHMVYIIPVRKVKNFLIRKCNYVHYYHILL